MEEILSVREIQASDIGSLVDYWISSDKLHLTNMGVDLNKLPPPEELAGTLLKHIQTPLEQRVSYCVIWEVNNQPVGHSNTNPTHFGKEAFMHLHLWNQGARSKGIGSRLLELTLPHFFETLMLKDLYCQPYALNPPPNKTLEKAGFEFVKEYITVPGSVNFEQPVKLWHLSREKYRQLYKTRT